MPSPEAGALAGLRFRESGLLGELLPVPGLHFGELILAAQLHRHPGRKARVNRRGQHVVHSSAKTGVASA